MPTAKELYEKDSENFLEKAKGITFTAKSGKQYEVDGDSLLKSSTTEEYCIPLLRLNDNKQVKVRLSHLHLLLYEEQKEIEELELVSTPKPAKPVKSPKTIEDLVRKPGVRMPAIDKGKILRDSKINPKE